MLSLGGLCIICTSCSRCLQTIKNGQVSGGGGGLKSLPGGEVETYLKTNGNDSEEEEGDDQFDVDENRPLVNL